MITVVGILGDSLEELSSIARAKVLNAKTIIGAQWRVEALSRQLDISSVNLLSYPKPFNNLAETLAHVSQPCVILASGDPGFFGVTRYLSESRIDFEVVPSPSSVAYAAARVRTSWEHLVVLSAHGRDHEEFKKRVRKTVLDPSQGIAVLCGPTFPPEYVVETLQESLEPTDQVWILEDLLTDKERISGPYPKIRRYSPNSVVLVLRAQTGGAPPITLATKARSSLSAFDEERFSHPDSNYSKIEIKALVPALLQIDSLPFGSRILEVGAGYGGVGIAMSRLRPDLELYQFERNETKVATIRLNLQNFKVKSTLIADAFTPNAISEIKPRAVFFGGGGVQLAATTHKLAPRGTRICVSFVSPEEVSLAYEAFGNVKEVFSHNLIRFGDKEDRTRLVSSNPVFLAWNEF